jgi:hypothetical protein
MKRKLDALGWWLMTIPCGIRKPSVGFLRYGPHRWGGALYNRRWFTS